MGYVDVVSSQSRFALQTSMNDGKALSHANEKLMDLHTVASEKSWDANLAAVCMIFLEIITLGIAFGIAYGVTKAVDHEANKQYRANEKAVSAEIEAVNQAVSNIIFTRDLFKSVEGVSEEEKEEQLDALRNDYETAAQKLVSSLVLFTKDAENCEAIRKDFINDCVEKLPGELETADTENLSKEIRKDLHAKVREFDAAFKTLVNLA